MQLENDGFFQLTYCTNIHPGNGWDEVFANVRKYGPALKERLSPKSPFGLGLRLSAKESEELLHKDCLKQFHAFLAEEGLYVSLLNGFPFGSFHHQVIKAEVFAPDWRAEERVRYTLRLIQILQKLLPKELDGGSRLFPYHISDGLPTMTTRRGKVLHATSCAWPRRWSESGRMMVA